MARKEIVTVEFTDDIDGGKADQTISFSYDGTNYQIDLSKKNCTAMAKALKPYVDAARKVRGTRSRASSGSAKGSSRNDLAQIRAWAKKNGHQVSDRGRISASVVEAYDAS